MRTRARTGGPRSPRSPRSSRSSGRPCAWRGPQRPVPRGASSARSSCGATRSSAAPWTGKVPHQDPLLTTAAW
eukprot:9222146-Pyramimonas_sp.AAC.1